MSSTDAIGEVPVFKYFDLGPYLGRGGTLEAFMIMNKIKYEEAKKVPWASEEWATLKKELVATGKNPAAHLPMLKLNGKDFASHVPIMRFLSKKTGTYGSDPLQDFEVDRVADEYQSWRDAWATANFTTDDAVRQQYVDSRPDKYKLMETFYARNEGPLLMGGSVPGFTDAAVFAIMLDDQQGMGDMDFGPYPHLKALTDACMEMPGVRDWLKGKERVK